MRTRLHAVPFPSEVGEFAEEIRAGRARATLEDGELRVRLPKIADRRGLAIQIAIAKSS